MCVTTLIFTRTAFPTRPFGYRAQRGRGPNTARRSQSPGRACPHRQGPEFSVETLMAAGGMTQMDVLCPRWCVSPLPTMLLPAEANACDECIFAQVTLTLPAQSFVSFPPPPSGLFVCVYVHVGFGVPSVAGALCLVLDMTLPESVLLGTADGAIHAGPRRECDECCVCA
eukprot:TRINITY_DN44150_c0_g1_i1.p3 TRINITY_DN44150_c0_g1~~TRINITY_DN44150_c0_g1_i1.p3  ORF type:complete len:170 (+),score=3.79 TRINITY_DN44150_c0_g1_i1:578-1087(+)